jgi:hypothetical protein
MMKVSAIVNEIDENFETNDSFPATLINFSHVIHLFPPKSTFLGRNVFKYFLRMYRKNGSSSALS